MRWIFDDESEEQKNRGVKNLDRCIAVDTFWVQATT